MVSTSGRTSSRRAGMMDWANLITISRLLATPQTAQHSTAAGFLTQGGQHCLLRYVPRPRWQ